MMEMNNSQISPAEMKVIASIVAKDQAAIDKAFADGLYVAGQRYVLTRVEDNIYARAVCFQDTGFDSHIMDSGSVLIYVARVVTVLPSSPPRPPSFSASTARPRLPETPPQSSLPSPSTSRVPDTKLDQR